jgi:hypothetical protein
MGASSAIKAIYDEIALGAPQPTILPLDLAAASADDFDRWPARFVPSSDASTASCTLQRSSARSVRSSIKRSMRGRKSCASI